MAIFLTGQSRVMIQGITGSEGRKHGARMLAAGTRIVGGTNPRKAGQTVEMNGTDVPVFGTVADTMAATGADVSVVFVPASGTKDAVIEAIEAQIPLCIVITEGIPVHDTAEFWARASAAGNRTRIIGPNCPGVASPGKSNAGIIPADITTEGRIGLVSKSGTLTYQMMYELRDIGFSTAVGIGGDPVIGTTHIDCLRAFQEDPETDAIVITEGIPVHDTAEFWAYATAKGNRTRIVGPNCPGVASPGKSNAGIIPADITAEGRIGLVSKSGTLTYQMMYELRDIGFSTCVGIGGDPVIGTTHIDCLRAFSDDPETDAIVMIGEIGGDAEERAALFIEQHVSKPVVAYVAGFTAPEGKTMGHAGAIVSGSSGTAQAKKEALEKVGVRVGRTPSETARLIREVVPGR